MHISHKAFQAHSASKHIPCIKIYLNEIERELRYPPKPSETYANFRLRTRGTTLSMLSPGTTKITRTSTNT